MGEERKSWIRNAMQKKLFTYLRLELLRLSQTVRSQFVFWYFSAVVKFQINKEITIIIIILSLFCHLFAEPSL